MLSPGLSLRPLKLVGVFLSLYALKSAEEDLISFDYSDIVLSIFIGASMISSTSTLKGSFSTEVL